MVTVTETREAPKTHGAKLPQGQGPGQELGTEKHPKKPANRRWLYIGVAVGVTVIGGGAWGLLRGKGSAGEAQVALYTVQPTAFDVKVKLSGEIKAIKNVEIKSLVEGQTEIIEIVKEGTMVKEGEVLVKLRSDQIKDKVEDSRIRVENAKAAVINAKESLTIQLNQNESDIKAAEMAADLSKLDYEQFDKGDAKIEWSTRQTAFENAQTDLKRKTDDLARVKELSANGFVSNNDVLDAEMAFRDSTNKRMKAEMDLELWKKYTEPKQRQTLGRKRDEGDRELDRVKRKAGAAILQKEADLRSKEATLRVESSRLDNLEKQFENCIIKAPQPGMVVYQSSVNSGNWGNTPIEEGVQVRQNQVLIQLPDTSKMMAEVRIAEQLTDRIQKGQQALVTVDAIPGKVYAGHVQTISVLPDGSNRHMNPNLKEYPTQVVLSESPTGGKPGQSAKVEIEVARLQDVIAVPIQTVFVGGGQSYVYVGTAEKYEKRIVKPGLSSADQMEIKDGLKPGETILMSRPKGAPEDQPASRPNGERKRRDGGGGGGGGTGGNGGKGA